MKCDYVHGYSERESGRLNDQASTLQGLLHYDTLYPAGCRVLEAGCGVGAQTAILARNSPEALFTCMDISEDSLRLAEAHARSEGLTNVEFVHADLFDLPFPESSFDAVFLCFVLEHLPKPGQALLALRKVMRDRGHLTVIEGDHGSCYFHPDSEHAQKAIGCLVKDQANIGRGCQHRKEAFPSGHLGRVR